MLKINKTKNPPLRRIFCFIMFTFISRILYPPQRRTTIIYLFRKLPSEIKRHFLNSFRCRTRPCTKQGLPLIIVADYNTDVVSANRRNTFSLFTFHPPRRTSIVSVALSLLRYHYRSGGYYPLLTSTKIV